MRDDEFTEIYKKLVPQLDKYFHVCLKNQKYPPPYFDIKRDLISLTAYDAFLNSRKESLSGYSIEALIWEKAKNVWCDFVHPRKSKTFEVECLKDEKSDQHDALHQLLVKEQLEQIKAKVDPRAWQIVEMRADGQSYSQIAESLDEKEGKIKMKIYRLKKRLEKESLRFL